jgi:hypothetical protein
MAVSLPLWFGYSDVTQTRSREAIATQVGRPLCCQDIVLRGSERLYGNAHLGGRIACGRG